MSGLLRQHAHPRAARQRDHARIRLHAARDQLKQRGLTAAVDADQTHALSSLQRQAGILQHGVHLRTIYSMF